MRLTQHTDYSLRVLTYLGLCDEVATIQQIADAFGISKNHLMKVVQKLARAGYVESLRGQGGGLRLKMKSADISIGGVVRDMEPELNLVECQKDEDSCIISPACRLKHLLNESRKVFMEDLDKKSLQDLLPPATRRDLINLLVIDT